MDICGFLKLGSPSGWEAEQQTLRVGCCFSFGTLPNPFNWPYFEVQLTDSELIKYRLVRDSASGVRFLLKVGLNLSCPALPVWNSDDVLSCQF